MITAPELLLAQFAVSKGLGDRSLQSDAVMVIDGFEHITALLKSFPWPVLSSAGEAEVWLPGGQKSYQPQQLETALQGQVIITETKVGHARAAIEALALQGTFDAKVFEGRPEAFTQGAILRGCFLKVEPSERDAENRAQVTQYSGTLFYNYFGEKIAGTLRG